MGKKFRGGGEMDKWENKAGSGPASFIVELADGRMRRRYIDHLRTADRQVKKSGGSKSETQDEQMTHSAKEEEKRTALEELTGVQIEQDTPQGGENETENETDERGGKIDENETDERGETTRKQEVAIYVDIDIS